MAATNKPKVLTERVLITLAPEERTMLNELAGLQQVPATEIARRAIREMHARLTEENR